MGYGGINSEFRVYLGIDRGFIFFENIPGVPWRGITDIEEREEDYTIEKYYLEGRLIGRRYIKGNYSATISSYDDPFVHPDISEPPVAISYRESFRTEQGEFYRLHIVHGVTMIQTGATRSSLSDSPEADTFSWEAYSIDEELSDEVVGSHLILDSSLIYPWVLRDIEAVLYGYPDGGARIPSIDELYEFFAMMNLVIIDHGDGTWSAVGHDAMVAMIDATEFEIVSPTIYFDEEHPRTFDIESLIRDERWLE